jgi:hypothetical protein
MSSKEELSKTLVAPWDFPQTRRSRKKSSAPPQSFSVRNVFYRAVYSFTQSWMHEIIGLSLSFFVLILVAVWTSSFWSNAYFYVFQTAVQAECLVLDSRQVISIDSFGMDREPLYRAEVSVYVFASVDQSVSASCTSNSSKSVTRAPLNPPSTACSSSAGTSDGWIGTAFDDARGIYSSGDKAGFLRAHGQPGTFYTCWHTHDRTVVLLVRDARPAMILPPLLSALLALAALARVVVLIYAAATSPSAVAVEEAWEEEAELV